MKTMTVKTGFGYFTDKTGLIIAKAILPIGEHPLKDDFYYGEVADQAELDLVKVYVDPAIAEASAKEQLIQGKIRQTAIAALKVEGKLPADFGDKI